MLHQPWLGALGNVVLDAVVAAQQPREAVLQEALRGAHKEPAGPHLHILLPEVLEEEEEENIWNFNFQRRWDPQPPTPLQGDAGGGSLVGLSVLSPTSLGWGDFLLAFLFMKWAEHCP